MQSFDLTPKSKAVPPLTKWGRYDSSTPVTEQTVLYQGAINDLGREYKTRICLSSTDVWSNQWATDVLKQMSRASYPLRELLEMKTTVPGDVGWLLHWELYARTIIPNLSNRIQRRIAGMKSRANNLRGVPVRTFHVHADDRTSVQAMQQAISRVEYETKSQILWDWLATYTIRGADDNMRIEIAKNKNNWVTSVDADGEISLANMRAWKNKISIKLKIADVIIVDNLKDDTKNYGVAFALANVGPGGIAAVMLPQIDTTSIVSLIHLFAQCFERTEIIHTMACDRLYLCGVGFLDTLTSKHQKLLYEFCESVVDAPNQSLFSPDYAQSEEYIETTDRLIRVNVYIHNWRFEYYSKLLRSYHTFIKSSAAETFDNYLDYFMKSLYKDESRAWMTRTGFNFAIDS